MTIEKIENRIEELKNEIENEEEKLKICGYGTGDLMYIEGLKYELNELEKQLEETEDLIMTNERLMTLLHNAIICLEEYGCDKEQLEIDLGITEEEYAKVMED